MEKESFCLQYCHFVQNKSRVFCPFLSEREVKEAELLVQLVHHHVSVKELHSTKRSKLYWSFDFERMNKSVNGQIL